MQALLGASRAVAFDLTAACSGFVLALVTGAQYIKTGTARNVLVIGADALSRYVDWRDRCAPSGAGQALGLTCSQTVLLPRAYPGPPCIQVPTAQGSVLGIFMHARPSKGDCSAPLL